MPVPPIDHNKVLELAELYEELGIGTPRRGGSTLNDQLIASHIARALQAAHNRIGEDNKLTDQAGVDQQRGVRRAAAHIADALRAFGIDPTEFLQEAGYGS